LGCSNGARSIKTAVNHEHTRALRNKAEAGWG
jgi:hypothetical protein